MKDIPMVDLKGQYLEIKGDIDVAIQNVLDSTAYINGPEVNKFQSELENYLSVRNVIPCGNGTDALQISLMALGLNPGDEVITVDFTFVATVGAIALLGLVPVFVDVDPETFTIDVEALKKVITPKTKAIIPVHLFGQSADMEPILEIAKDNDLFVIEDTAQAIGCDYKFRDGSIQKTGTIGDIGTTSFFPSKNLGCYGDGGAVFTNNDNLAKKIRSLVNHGMTVRYYHDHVGVNSRLDTLQAAILSVKLPKLDQYNSQRIKAANYYDQAFADCEFIQTPVRSVHSNHIFHQYTMVLKGVDRSALQRFLKEKGIPAPIYYPVPLHLQEAYKDSRYEAGDFPVTEMLCNSVMSLPIHTEMDEDTLKYITNSLLEFFN